MLFVAFQLGFGGDGEDERLLDVLLLGLFFHAADVDLQVFFAEEVFLLEYEDDFFAPLLLDEVEEIPGRLAVGIFGFKDEDDEIRGGDEALGDFLMLLNDGVGAGRIHDGDFAQDVHGQVYLFQKGVDGNDLLFFAIEDLQHLVGHGLRSDLGDFAPRVEQGIDEAALSGLDFACHDEHEGLVQAVAQLVDGVVELLMPDLPAKGVKLLDQLVYLCPLCQQPAV